MNLENPYLQFVLSPLNSSWSLHPASDHEFRLQDVLMAVAYRQNRARFKTGADLRGGGAQERVQPDSPHGALQQIELRLPADPNGVRCEYSFRVPADLPLFFWRVVVHNQGAQPVYLDRLILLQAHFERGLERPAFFSNGWGSWNDSGAYGAQDRQRRTRLGPFTAPMRVNAGTPQPKRAGRFASDMFAVLGDRGSRQALLAGFLSQREHFGTLEARLDRRPAALVFWANGDHARLDPGGQIASDWACIQFVDVDARDPLGPFLDAVARQNDVGPVPEGSLSGWCSWYQFFTDISQEVIERNLAAIVAMQNRLPLDIVQIDDGFETMPGDWLHFKPEFPQGIAPLAQAIHTQGLTPGLWLAPYILDRRSRLAQEHPDWLLRGQLNRPVNAGFIWDTFTTALDLTHPDALAYTEEVIHTAVHEWGFPYLKLDFLYAAALPGRYRDPARTRAQVLRAGLEALRAAAGEETFLLGCGCPLGSALGLVDAMRIGADVAPSWFPAYPLIQPYFKSEPDVPAARNAIQNALTRLPLHKRWWTNDPDCLLLRPQTTLSLEEVHSLATVIAMGDGMLLLSDDLPALPEARLRIAQALLPPLGKPARAYDWFDESTPRRLRVDLENVSGGWHLLALFNWDDLSRQETLQLANFGLDAREPYIAREFWKSETRLVSGGRLDIGLMPAHSVVLYAVRRFTPETAQYLGGNLHISQGLEVCRWEQLENGLRIELARPGHTRGEIEVSLPGRLQSANAGGRPLLWQEIRKGIYRFQVEFDRSLEVRVGY